MTDEEIAILANELKEETQGANSTVKCIQHGGGADESYITGTRAGYLQLSALFLLAATAPQKDGSKHVDVGTDNIFHEDSDVFINWLERDETLQTPKYVAPQLSLKDKIWLVVCNSGCFALAFAIFALIIVGFSTTLKWLFS